MTAEKNTTTPALPTPIELAKETWVIYKDRFWTVVGIGLFGYLGVVVAIVAAAIFGVLAFFLLGGKFQPSIVGVGALLGIAIIIGISLLSTWISASIIINITHWQKKIGIKQSYGQAKPFIVPLFLTSLFSGLIIFGSMFVLLVPAFIFIVWFSFAQYSVILDKRSGLEALHASREYVRGRFWKVIWLMIAVHFPEIALGIVFTSGGDGKNNGGLGSIFQLLSLLAIPFYQVYMYSLFIHLRKTTTSSLANVSKNSRLVYLLVPALGYLLFIIGLVAVAPSIGKSMSTFPTLFNNFNSLSKQGDNIKPGTQIVTGIVLYYVAHQEYPKDLDVLVTDKILDEIPTYPISGLPYSYTVTSGGKDFKLCTPGIISPQKCVTSESGNFDL